jgi:hypothetical protein
MSTPTNPLSGVSGSAGVTLSASVKVDLEVMPQANSDIECHLSCNGQQCKVIYRATGELDFDVYPYSS